MQTSLILLVLGMIVIGAIAQRVAGLGFALVVSPFLILLLGIGLVPMLNSGSGSSSSY